MNLIVRFSDYNSGVIDAQHTGQMPPVQYRIVAIPLTNEQADLLRPRACARSCGENLYETIELIGLEEGR